MADSTWVGDGPEDELRHQLHHVPGGEVLAGLLIVVLAEAPDQLLEDRTHAVVVQTLQAHGLVGVERRSWAEVHRRVEELLDEEAQGAGFDQGLIWSRNRNFSSTSWTLAEKPSR